MGKRTIILTILNDKLYMNSTNNPYTDRTVRTTYYISHIMMYINS